MPKLAASNAPERLKKISVILVAGTDPGAHKTGGTDLYASNLFRRLSNMDVEAAFLGIKFRNSQPTPSFIPVCEDVKSGFRYLFFLFIKVMRLKIPADSIIQAQSPMELLPFLIFHRRNPLICRLSGKTTENVRRVHGRIIAWFYKRAEEFVLKRVDRCIAASENAKMDFVKEYPWLHDRIDVVLTGVDTSKFKGGRKRCANYGFGNEDEIILYVGRLEPEKRLGFLIKAYEIVKRNNPHAKLVLVGDGRERARLEMLVKQKKLEDIFFLGGIEHDEIPDIMDCANVLVLSSRSEGSPAVVKEALISGLPVVASDVGDVKKWINREVGRVVAGDEEEFAEAIIEVLSMNKERVKKACKEISKNLSFDMTLKKTVDIYKSVLKARGMNRPNYLQVRSGRLT